MDNTSLKNDPPIKLASSDNVNESSLGNYPPTKSTGFNNFNESSLNNDPPTKSISFDNINELSLNNDPQIKSTGDQKRKENVLNQITKKDIDQNKNQEYLQPAFSENLVKYLKLGHSLIIKSKEMCTALNQAINFDPKTKENIEICQLLPQKLVKIMMQSTTFHNDNSSFNNVYFEVNFPKVELNLEKINIKPTEAIKMAIDNALKNEKPYQELFKVFDTFGYLLSRKFILGQKLYKSSVLRQKSTNTDDELEIELKIEEFFENYSSKLDDMLRKYGFDATYLLSMNGEAIKINDIEKWLNEHSKSLQVISRSELLPVYEIFEDPISYKIQKVLGIDNQQKILMTGITQFIENTKYYHIDFYSHLESCNYHIFAKVVRHTNNGLVDTIDKAIVKIHSKNRTGFFAAIESFNEINDIDPTDLQIVWILVGFPDEINFYSVHTRELSLLSIEVQNITLENNQESVLINVPKELPKNSIMTLSFEYPLFSNNLEIKNGKIELNINYNLSNNDTCYEDAKSENNKYGNVESESVESESDESEDEYSEYVIQYPLCSCVFVSDEEFIEADISTSNYKNIYLKSVGLLIQ
ncbi:13817_t:CDS:2 [Gigaspora margarita]|uniref:13817_t:CDS:1 n=1 Tax=Gigaspora margarita TaxID=4874 RepID=A0ABM8VX55_GIGMA|nr:13817_t:CDS:2 [Gigaspora margarita]